MRDINRIDKCCEKLALIWKKCPDLRLCQLFNNFQRHSGSDCFYIEDDDFIERLEKYIAEITRGD